jgi:hypothetical protein
MPAIDPAWLAKEVEEIRASFMDSSAVRRRVIDLLEFFSDRTRHPGTSIRISDVEKNFGAPRPVIHALERGLKQMVLEHPDCEAAISEELWKTEYRESRTIAIALIQTRSFDEFLLQVEGWSQQTDDVYLLESLARTLSSKWGAEDYKDFAQIILKWLRSETKSLQILATLCMQSVVMDKRFNDLPCIFNLILAHEFGEDLHLRRVFSGLVQALIQRSAPEAARFLLDLSEKDATMGRKLIRDFLDQFPDQQQPRLNHILSS